MRISLVRHGQSESNIGIHDHSAAGDHKVNLTGTGMTQARGAGYLLQEELQATEEGHTLIYCSPYRRTRQTLEQMLLGGEVRQLPRVFEDARLREIERGYGNSEEQQALRKIHGWFYYRYAGGESPADCFDRISSFLESMMRQVERKKPDDVVIVTHGLAIRCFIMRFMHLTVEQFESLDNPDNCDIITIDLKENIEAPVFVSGRWAVEGIRLRS
ncbi:histidine phosphatase family protein [Xanthomonas phage RTH11]|nr:histidine phosphatase family protein [Xanthomonas phage RTH11]